MKNRIKKEVIVFVLAFFCSLAAFAQDDVVLTTLVKNRVRVPENAIAFNLGYKIPMLNNALVKNNFWDKKLGTDVDFSMDFRKQFMIKKIEDDEVISVPTWFAVGVGVGISYFRKSIGFKNYTETLSNYKDNDYNNIKDVPDDDICTLFLKYNDVSEKISLTYLDIPVYIEIGRPNRMKTSAFFKLGVKASVLVSGNVVGEGFYTSEGYYPQWDVKLHDITILDYYSNKPYNLDSENSNKSVYNLSPFVLWGSVSAGVNFPFSNVKKNRIAKWMLRIGAQIDYSLTPISKSLPDDAPFTKSGKSPNFRLFQSNMLGGDGSKIFSAGLTVGLIYCL